MSSLFGGLSWFFDLDDKPEHTPASLRHPDDQIRERAQRWVLRFNLAQFYGLSEWEKSNLSRFYAEKVYFVLSKDPSEVPEPEVRAIKLMMDIVESGIDVKGPLRHDLISSTFDGYPAAASFSLGMGADISADELGLTALDYAKEKGCPLLLKVYEIHGISSW